MNPILGYSLAAWRRDGYQQVEAWLQRLKELRFRSVTLTPTYLVYDEDPPRLDVAKGPSIDELSAAILGARQAGFRVRLEPHLDYETTLTGGPYKWRSSMKLDPLGAYLDEVLLPLVALGSDAMTLGSELGDSLALYPERWNEARQRLAGWPISLGHKTNHDSLNSAGAGVRNYLRQLDWVSFSFYPPLSSADVNEFEGNLRRLAGQLSENVEFAVGEMGLGSADVTKPWEVDGASLTSPEALGIRRRFYLNLLAALRRTADLFGPEGATFWTVTHFDILGVMDPRFRDDALTETVIAYNQEQS